jgi:hypothetical protein
MFTHLIVISSIVAKPRLMLSGWKRLLPDMNWIYFNSSTSGISQDLSQNAFSPPYIPTSGNGLFPDVGIQLDSSPLGTSGPKQSVTLP